MVRHNVVPAVQHLSRESRRQQGATVMSTQELQVHTEAHAPMKKSAGHVIVDTLVAHG